MCSEGEKGKKWNGECGGVEKKQKKKQSRKRKLED
jgi:hypothetical protein